MNAGTGQVNFMAVSGGSTSVFQLPPQRYWIVVVATIGVLLLLTLFTWVVHLHRHPWCSWLFYRPLYKPFDWYLCRKLFNPFTQLTLGMVVLFGVWFGGMIVFSIVMANGLLEPKLYRGFGAATIYGFAFIFFPNLRNTPWPILLGASFERAVKYHTWLGYVLFIVMTIHGAGMIQNFQDQAFKWNNENGKNTTAGFIAWIAFFPLLFTSLPYVRRRWWEVFLYSHFLLAPVVIVFACLHDYRVAVAMCVSFALLVFDMLVRGFHELFFSGTVSEVSVVGDIISIRINTNRNFHFCAGQYIFIKNLRFSWLQWHPFTIVPVDDLESATFARGFQILVKRIRPGSFTDALVSGKSALRPGDYVSLDGPYGKLTVPLFAHQTTVLIAGGIGVTPMLSILESLTLYNNSCGLKPQPYPSPQRIVFAHQTRSHQMLDLVQPFLIRAARRASLSNGMLSFVPILCVSGSSPNTQTAATSNNIFDASIDSLARPTVEMHQPPLPTLPIAPEFLHHDAPATPTSSATDCPQPLAPTSGLAVGVLGSDAFVPAPLAALASTPTVEKPASPWSYYEPNLIPAPIPRKASSFSGIGFHSADTRVTPFATVGHTNSGNSLGTLTTTVYVAANTNSSPPSPPPPSPNTHQPQHQHEHEQHFIARLNGRINLADLLRSEADGAMERYEEYVAVYVCGPEPMMRAVETLVFDLNRRPRSVTLLLHKETFEL